MIITAVAQTFVTTVPDSLKGAEFFEREDWQELDTSDLDLLAEMAGRGCYKSWSLPNPKTATNEGYMGNIIDQTHFSVVEHGSVTFYVEGVSRALLLELERHRHISFSVESQRFVNTEKAHPEPVTPPLWAEDEELTLMLSEHYKDALAKYDYAYTKYRDQGVPVKQAREAARAFLPESTPVDFFVTGNMRAWRDILFKRLDPAADAEIREFSTEILTVLKRVAPASFQDVELPEK